MKPALSQVCSLPSPWQNDIKEYAAAGCRAVEIWLGKLEMFLESHTADDARRVLEAHEMAAPAAAFQGGLLSSQGDARREHWLHFARRLDLCRQVGIGTLIVACDVSGPLGEQDLDRIRFSLREAGRQAGDRGVRIALEFQARAALGNNLETAAMLVAETGDPNVGICFDAFHFHVGPSKSEDLAYLTRENLYHVQLCDLAGVVRETATDSDRILPGDGDLPLASILEHFRKLGYDGYISLELMNPVFWSAAPNQFADLALRALRRVMVES